MDIGERLALLQILCHAIVSTYVFQEDQAVADVHSWSGPVFLGRNPTTANVAAKTASYATWRSVTAVAGPNGLGTKESESSNCRSDSMMQNGYN